MVNGKVDWRGNVSRKGNEELSASVVVGVRKVLRCRKAIR